MLVILHVVITLVNTDLWVSVCIFVVAEKTPRSLHCEDVGIVADVSEVNTSSVLIIIPDVGGSMYLRNVRSTAHIRTE
jgi:hypothetical protein